MESLRRNETLSAALAAITAAVVGIILNLAVWFAMQCPADAAAVVAVFRFKGLLTVLAGKRACRAGR